MRVKKGKLAAGILGVAALAAAGCTSTSTKTVPGPTVTATVIPPAATVTATVPGPTVTVTTTAQPPTLASKSWGGSANWNSPPFELSCTSPAVNVNYSYSNNQDSNFIADLQSSSDDQNIANTIGSSGGTNTTVYPQPQSTTDTYHLSVTATGSWTFKLSETC